jgi:hypothetical protein
VWLLQLFFTLALTIFARRQETKAIHQSNNNLTSNITMAEAQRQRLADEKRAYNRLVSARARQKTKQTIASLEATVETQAKRLLELEQMRSVLLEQVRLMATEKSKVEQALLQERSHGGFAANGHQDHTNPGGCLPIEQPHARRASDANPLLLAVLRENVLGSATPRRPSEVTIPQSIVGTPQAARLSAARAAAATTDFMHRQLSDLVATSVNASLLGNVNNTTSTYRLTPHNQPPIIAPPRGSTTLLHAGGNTAGLSPPTPLHENHEELLAILQLLQMNRAARERSTSGPRG